MLAVLTYNNFLKQIWPIWRHDGSVWRFQQEITLISNNLRRIMELERGICSLCSETSSKVLPRLVADDFIKLLPKILQENFLTDVELQKIKDSIKICLICSFKIQTANERKASMKKAKGDDKVKNCCFCGVDKSVLKLKADVKYISSRFEGFVQPADFPVCVCLSCFFYFDTVFNIRTKLLSKFPQLASKPAKSPSKQNETPKRKSDSRSPPSTKKRKIFDDCFTYLQPLSNNSYYVHESLKKDSRLYRKIPYVNLQEAKSLKVTPRARPVIKIKLKKNKARRTEKNNSKVSENKTLPEDYLAFRTASLINRAKSEELKNKANSQPPEAEGEKLEETPKSAASTTNSVPKRRVSLFAGTNDQDDKEKDDQDEINVIVNKYIQDSTFDDNSKLDLLREVTETAIQADKKIEENGLEKSIAADEAEAKEVDEGDKQIENNSSENGEEVVTQHDSEDITPASSGKVTPENSNQMAAENSEEVTSDVSEEANFANKSDCSLSSGEALARKPSPRSDSANEGSDSDESERRENKDLDRDSLNGSEKKKKRVTFSDEIN